MAAEQTLLAWVRRNFVLPKRLVFRPDNLYYQAMLPAIQAGMKPKKKKRQRRRNRHKGKENAFDWYFPSRLDYTLTFLGLPRFFFGGSSGFGSSPSVCNITS